MESQVVTRPVVVTKYIGPTDHRGSRVRATGPAGQSVVVSWDHRINAEGNHAAAAAALADKVWGFKTGELTMVGCSIADGRHAFALLLPTDNRPR